MEQNNKSRTAQYVNTVIAFFHHIKMLKNRMNQHMEGKYSPSLIAMITAAIATVLIIIMLFIPNCLGVAEDGTLTHIMNSAGVHYIEGEDASDYNNYFVRIYSNVVTNDKQSDKAITSHILLVRAAVRLDSLFTRDNMFDIRFLALIYTFFFVPAIYLLIKQACMRVKKFSEGIAIAVAGLFMYTDVAYVTYFNSFYPEAIWYISFMYCAGAAISFQEQRSMFHDIGGLLLLVVSSCVLITSKWQCAFIGILIVLYCLKLIFCRRDWVWSIFCVFGALFVSVASISGIMGANRDFNETSKFHAMTRGVLFSSDHPAKTLEEFGIGSSYEMLTDVSAYDALPFVLADNEILKEEFLDQYSAFDIGVHYLRHPGKFLRMTDIAIKSCFGIRRNACGNYEKSVGLPPGARSFVWSAWSTFKMNFAPNTIGYLLILIIGVGILFGKEYSLRPVEDKKSTILFDSMMLLLIICFVQAGVTIINSGDAEMTQRCFLISSSIDFMTYFVFAELIQKMKIF